MHTIHTIHPFTHPSIKSTYTLIHLSTHLPTDPNTGFLTKSNRFHKFEQFPRRAVEKSTTAEGFFAELVTVQEDHHLGAHSPSMGSSKVELIVCVLFLYSHGYVRVCLYIHIPISIHFYPIYVFVSTFISVPLSLLLAIRASVSI